MSARNAGDWDESDAGAEDERVEMTSAGSARLDLESLQKSVEFDDRGLVPVVAQDEENGEVLMLAYANREALRLTLESGRAHYYSRSRQELWRKGDSSGNRQQVSEVSVDCDGDAVLYRVRQQGPACHTGSKSCFFRSTSVTMQRQARLERDGPVEGDRAAEPIDVDEGAADRSAGSSARTAEHAGEVPGGAGHSLALLERVVARRLRDLPEGSYVAGLHHRGLGYMAQKVVEEAGETVVAALQRRDEELLNEAADLVFHLTVLLHESGQGLAPVLSLLEQRHRSRDEA